MRALLNKFILIAAASLAQAAVATPSITNGSFDTGLSAWTAGGGCAVAAWLPSGGNGTGAVQLNSCGESWADSTVSQTVTGLTIGHTYLLSWDQRLDDNYSGSGYGKSFGVFLGADGGNPLFTNEYLVKTWKGFSTSFTATSTSQLITFAGELDQRTTGVLLSTDVSYLLDNVALKDTTVPEPTSITLLGLGMGALALRRRKKA